MLKKIFKSKFHLRFIVAPYVKYLANNLGDYIGVNQNPRDIPIVVSLTSYSERFDDLIYSLYSLLNQNLKPDKIILWLSNSDVNYNNINLLPYEITRYIKNGLEIRFVEDIRSYTKIFYALKEYSNSIIVTADDDVFYPSSWLETLYYSYVANPEDIQVHRAHRVCIDSKKRFIKPYELWDKHVKEESARYDNFLTGVGGVLYPPKCFKNEVFRKDIFLKYAPNADDIWLWVMALLSNRKIRVVKNHITTLRCTNILRQLFQTSKTLYAQNSKGENDTQLQQLLELYGNSILVKLCNKNYYK